MARTPSPITHYIQRLYAPEDALLVRIREQCVALNRDWQVGAEEGKLLQLLLKMHASKRVVEIGTLLGYSTLWMARGLPADGHLTTLERDANHAALARGYIAESDVANRITLLEGDAKTSLAQLSDQAPFDAVFIDADKPSYNAYLDWAQAHVRAGGLIIADNTLFFGSAHMASPPEGVAPNTWKAMRQFNERLADRALFDAVMIPTEEGLTVAVKR